QYTQPRTTRHVACPLRRQAQRDYRIYIRGMGPGPFGGPSPLPDPPLPPTHCRRLGPDHKVRWTRRGLSVAFGGRVDSDAHANRCLHLGSAKDTRALALERLASGRQRPYPAPDIPKHIAPSHSPPAKDPPSARVDSVFSHIVVVASRRCE